MENERDKYGRMVCLFLAEGLRSRKITLARAAEIAEKVLIHYKLIDTEKDFLDLIKELSKDFEELSVLEEKVNRHHAFGERRELEQKVRDFSISVMASDSEMALGILQDAAQEQSTIEQLEFKYPEFKQFNENISNANPRT